jgi:hypothetical protein
LKLLHLTFENKQDEHRELQRNVAGLPSGLPTSLQTSVLPGVIGPKPVASTYKPFGGLTSYSDALQQQQYHHETQQALKQQQQQAIATKKHLHHTSMNLNDYGKSNSQSGLTVIPGNPTQPPTTTPSPNTATPDANGIGNATAIEPAPNSNNNTTPQPVSATGPPSLTPSQPDFVAVSPQAIPSTVSLPPRVPSLHVAREPSRHSSGRASSQGIAIGVNQPNANASQQPASVPSSQITPGQQLSPRNTSPHGSNPPPMTTTTTTTTSQQPQAPQQQQPNTATVQQPSVSPSTAPTMPFAPYHQPNTAQPATGQAQQTQPTKLLPKSYMPKPLLQPLRPQLRTSTDTEQLAAMNPFNPNNTYANSNVGANPSPSLIPTTPMPNPNASLSLNPTNPINLTPTNPINLSPTNSNNLNPAANATNIASDAK